MAKDEGTERVKSRKTGKEKDFFFPFCVELLRKRWRLRDQKKERGVVERERERKGESVRRALLFAMGLHSTFGQSPFSLSLSLPPSLYTRRHTHTRTPSFSHATRITSKENGTVVEVVVVTLKPTLSLSHILSLPLPPLSLASILFEDFYFRHQLATRRQ